jgi:hypothetical protein
MAESLRKGNFLLKIQNEEKNINFIKLIYLTRVFLAILNFITLIYLIKAGEF